MALTLTLYKGFWLEPLENCSSKEKDQNNYISLFQIFILQELNIRKVI